MSTYILDTNVLLYDPYALTSFPNQQIVIPINVIEEIDQFKKGLNETGKNARQVSKMLDELRMEGQLSEGVLLSNEGTLRVEFERGSKTHPHNPYKLNLSKASNRMLEVALRLRDEGESVILVTQDTNLRVKASAMGVAVSHYDQKKQGNQIYSGWREETEEVEEEPLPHQGWVQDYDQAAKTWKVSCFDAQKAEFFDLGKPETIWEITPRNPQQHLALHLLMDPKIHLVTLVGKAGTGKTLWALAAGLQMMLVQNQYNKLLVSRPVFPMGRDLGYLPGDIDEKLRPWMQPIFDNLELLIGGSSSYDSKGYHELMNQGVLTIEPLTYIRGRSISHQYMIVDEAQNLTPHEIKTILTRAGEGTKIVFTGDPEQIDNPYVDASSNGLSYIVEKFKGHPIAGHVTLSHGERSPLAELAANVL